jgi:hypothetical protein
VSLCQWWQLMPHIDASYLLFDIWREAPMHQLTFQGVFWLSWRTLKNVRKLQWLRPWHVTNIWLLSTFINGRLLNMSSNTLFSSFLTIHGRDMKHLLSIQVLPALPSNMSLKKVRNYILECALFAPTWSDQWQLLLFRLLENRFSI